MKRITPMFLAYACLVAAALIAFMPGCTTSQQTVTFNTLYGLENGVSSAYAAYTGLVIKGTVATNQVPAISKAFNTFQSAMLPALDAVQYSTNAIAPANLSTEASDILNLITVAEGK